MSRTLRYYLFSAVANMKQFRSNGVVFPLPVESGRGAALLFLYLYKIPLAVEAQTCRGRPTIFAIFLAKFVSVALSLSGFTVVLP
jgi:hypothetical protein